MNKNKDNARDARSLWREFEALAKKHGLTIAESAGLLNWGEPATRHAFRGALPARPEYIERLAACLERNRGAATRDALRLPPAQ